MTSSKTFSGDELEALKSWLPPEVQNQTEFEIETITAIGDPAKKTPPVAVEEEIDIPQLPTAQEIEEIRQQARTEGFEEGKRDGFEFGHKEALEQYREQFAEQAERINALCGKLDKPFQELDTQVENEVLVLVSTMVKQLVRREIFTDPSHIIGVVREALEILPVSARNIRILLNHEDAELIRTVYSVGETEKNWVIVEDPVIQRGGCKVLTETSQIDATLEGRLASLIAPLLSDSRGNPETDQEQDTDDDT